MKEVAITFDFDFINKEGNDRSRDEIEEFWPLFKEITSRFTDIKTTWFIRIDSHIEHFFGKADYFFIKHTDKIEWLRENGHSIGWHFHSFIKQGQRFVSNNNEDLLCEELKEMHKVIEKYELNILRMGFGFHSNKTLKTIEELGLKYDSSALPGMILNRNKTNADWSVTGQEPYFPSAEDYRKEGINKRSVLEIPLATVNYEDKSNRAWKIYPLNPAYDPATFSRLVSKTESGNSINTITHPFEIISGSKTNELIVKGINNFCENLNYLKRHNYIFKILTELNAVKTAKA